MATWWVWLLVLPICAQICWEIELLDILRFDISRGSPIVEPFSQPLNYAIDSEWSIATSHDVTFGKIVD